MTPIPGCISPRQPLVQSTPHLSQPTAHSLQVLVPLLLQFTALNDCRNNSRTKAWSGRNLRARDLLQYRFYFCCAGMVPGDDVQGTDSLSVQTEVFGERLCYRELERAV